MPMGVSQHARRALRKLSTLSLILRIDNITGARIVSRNDMVLIGNREYGGWVVPASLLGAESICYCVGCGEDISFDLGLIHQFGCHVFGFDPTPRAIKSVNAQTRNIKNYHFRDIGLWDKQDTLKFFAPQNPEHVSHSALNLQKTNEFFLAKVQRLSEIMKDNSHDKLDLLKLDVEGAEYKVIDSIIEDKIDIKILCVEFDEYYNPIDQHYAQRIKATVRKIIQNDYSLVSSQGNANYTFARNAARSSV